MGTTLATKHDVQLLKQEMDNRFALMSRDMATLEMKMTVKLGSLMAAGFGLTIAALRLWS